MRTFLSYERTTIQFRVNADCPDAELDTPRLRQAASPVCNTVCWPVPVIEGSRPDDPLDGARRTRITNMLGRDDHGFVDISAAGSR
jgi:hypothetical protein